MHRAIPLILAAVIASVPIVSARQQEEAMIPKRLVTLLFPGMAETIVEGMPDDLPDVLPEGATALVSTKTSWGVTVIAEVPSFTAAERPRYERKLLAAGWKEADGPAGVGGLMASSAPVPKMYCLGDRMLSYSAQPQLRGGTVLRLQVNDARRQGICDASGSRRPRSIFDDVDVPPLPPPDGARALDSSGGGGGDHMTQSSRLETTLPVAAVEAHYRALLTADGWNVESQAAGDGVSMARFALAPGTGADKSPRIATLEALSLPGGNVMVTLRVIGSRRSW